MEVKNKNEQGYALVTVLLIITVFTVIFLSFMGQAFSSVKQNQVIEKNTRSVAAAEMGISYYQVAIQEMFKKNQEIVNEHVSTIMDFETTDPDTFDFKREATIKMAEQLQGMIPSGTPTEPINNTILIGTPASPIKIDEHPNASFYIKDFVAEEAEENSTTPYKINISFTVVGTEDGKPTTLFTEMYIDLNTIVDLPTSENPDDYQLPSYNNIAKPRTNVCDSLQEINDKGTKIKICDNKLYIEGPKTLEGNNLFDNDLIIYTTDALTLTGTGNENNNSNINIHAEKDITVGKNMNSQTGLTIETNGNATFLQNLKIDTDSTLLVKENLSVSQQLDISTRSFAYVGGNATVNILKISSDSKMCVYGDLTYSGSITVPTNNDPMTLLVRGDVKKAGETTTRAEDVKYEADPLEFAQQCGTYVPPSFQINWGDRINPVISDVEY
jgi:hypothetical protein